MSGPLLIACSDLHLTETPPAFRSEEPDWFAAQARQLRWLSELKKELGCPVVIAGDIFDRAQGSSRLVNFVADNLPQSFACPGNHDLPYHSMERLDLSSYGSLIRMGIVDGVRGCRWFKHDDLDIALHLFPYGAALTDCVSQGDINIAVVHHYVWDKDSPLAKFKPECEISLVLDQLKGYDFYIFGDNHKPFQFDNVVNCGSFFRREKGDENYRPSVALIYRDRIELKPIPVESDIVTTIEEKEKKASAYDFSEFFSSLKEAEKMVCDVDRLLEIELERRSICGDLRQAIDRITRGGE